MTHDRLEDVESLEELEERRFERRLREELRATHQGGAAMNVLVVESDDGFRELYSTWLQAAGFDVLGCPGSQEPDFECAGASRYGCPLADTADLIVLDLELQSDLLLCGVAAWELLQYYRSVDRPVVVLSGADDAIRPLPGDRMAVLRHRPDRDALIEAIHVLLLAKELHPSAGPESLPDVPVPGTIRAALRERSSI